MKKLVATVCIIGSTLTLAACSGDGQGNVETQVPYAQERTAGDSNAPVRRVERTYRGAQNK